MKGRNGHDHLNQALVFVSLLFLCGSLMVFPRGFYMVSWVICFLVLYRYFSKNLYARNAENRYYMRKSRNIMMKFKQEQRVFLDKHHVYFFCPACHRRLRVPKGKGHVKVTCSYCDNVFTKKS